MSNQEDNTGWTVVARKKKVPKPKPKPKPTTSQPFYERNTSHEKPRPPQNDTVRKTYRGPNSQLKFVDARKIEDTINDEDTSMKNRTYSEKFRKRLLNIRTNNFLSQADFAAKLNIKKSILKDIESGTGIYSMVIVSRINQQLQKHKLT